MYDYEVTDGNGNLIRRREVKRPGQAMFELGVNTRLAEQALANQRMEISRQTQQDMFNQDRILRLDSQAAKKKRLDDFVEWF